MKIYNVMNRERIGNLIRKNELINRIITSFRLKREMKYHVSRFIRNTGAIGMKESESKFSADLRVRVHALEKGLSLPNPHVGFGEKKVAEVLDRVEYLENHFRNEDFLSEISVILNKYFEFQKIHGHVNEELLAKYQRLFEGVSDNGYQGGTKSISREELLKATSFEFKKFAESRYAIRDFSDEPVSEEILRRALEIAEKSPSACNRQPWRVYIYKGNKKNRILEWQGGCKGFSECIDTAILIACNIESYFISEMNLPYVDGGLYAMNLMYALHSLGIGTIPLTCALMARNFNALYRDFDIKDNEVPVLLIGVGNLKDKFEVAVSNRYSYKNYAYFIN